MHDAASENGDIFWQPTAQQADSAVWRYHEKTKQTNSQVLYSLFLYTLYSLLLSHYLTLCSAK